MENNKHDIWSLTYAEMEAYFKVNGENPAKSVYTYNALYKDKITDFREISGLYGLKADIPEMLSRDFTVGRLPIINKTENADAAKLLFALPDGNAVESVLMRHDYGDGLCISTQAGCNMRCVFCESGKTGKKRDLTAGEMVLQCIGVTEALGSRSPHITLMGIGEPLDNYYNVTNFINIITHQQGLDIAPRHITLSTCGLIPEMKRLLADNVKCNLAVSLHAPDDGLRRRLMPAARSCTVKELADVIGEFASVRNKKVTVQYTLLDGVNDGAECADALISLLSGIKCYVNLIPYNETGGGNFKRPPKEKVSAFYERLIRGGLRATVRREFGTGIRAACGQLAAGNVM